MSDTISISDVSSPLFTVSDTAGGERMWLLWASKSVVGVLFSPFVLRRLNLKNSSRSRFSDLRLSRLVQATFLAVLNRCSDAAEPGGQLWNLASWESTGYLFLFTLHQLNTVKMSDIYG